jgi:hypothetical protein
VLIRVASFIANLKLSFCAIYNSNKVQGLWVWQYEDEEDGELRSFEMERDEPIRFRVEAETFVDVGPTVDLTQQQRPGGAGGPTGGGKEVRAAPYTLTVGFLLPFWAHRNESNRTLILAFHAAVFSSRRRMWFTFLVGIRPVVSSSVPIPFLASSGMPKSGPRELIHLLKAVN